MKRGNLLVLAGGILGVVAVFLPFYWTSPEVGVFGPGISLLSGVQLYLPMLGSLNPFQLQPILSVVTILQPLRQKAPWLEPGEECRSPVPVSSLELRIVRHH